MTFPHFKGEIMFASFALGVSLVSHRLTIWIKGIIWKLNRKNLVTIKSWARLLLETDGILFRNFSSQRCSICPYLMIIIITTSNWSNKVWQTSYIIIFWYTVLLQTKNKISNRKRSCLKVFSKSFLIKFYEHIHPNIYFTTK